MSKIETEEEFYYDFGSSDLYLENPITKKIWEVTGCIRDCRCKNNIYTISDGITEYPATFAYIKNKYMYYTGKLEVAKDIINKNKMAKQHLNKQCNDTLSKLINKPYNEEEMLI